MKSTTPIILLSLVAACGGHDPDPLVFQNDCESCHLTEYQLTADPVHEQLFPPRCLACHSTEFWQPDDNSGHDVLFPISHGNHRGFDCQQCHPPPANTFEFTCLEPCHTRTKMDKKHDGKGGYRYESARCINCHPNG